MKKKIRIALVLLLVSALLFMIPGCGTKEESTAMKVALMVQGAANDNGWNQSALDGVNLVKDEIGAEVTVSENLDLSDFEEYFRNYGKEKYDIVFGHGYAFTDAAMKIAPEFPDTYFVITSTDASQEPNLLSVKNNTLHQGFLSGAFAGLYTQSGTVGIVGGMEIPSIISWLEGAKQGAEYVNPGVKVIANYTGNFEDSIAAKETSLAMIEQGADVLLQNLDPAGVGVLEACKEKNIAYVGSILDQYSLAPEVVVTSGLSDLSQSILKIAQLIQAGTVEIKSYQMGIAEGVISLAPFQGDWETKVSQDVKDRLEQLVSDVSAGKVEIKE